MELNQQELQDIARALMYVIEDLPEGGEMSRLLDLYDRVSENINEGPHSNRR